MKHNYFNSSCSSSSSCWNCVAFAALILLQFALTSTIMSPIRIRSCSISISSSMWRNQQMRIHHHHQGSSSTMTAAFFVNAFSARNWFPKEKTTRNRLLFFSGQSSPSSSSSFDKSINNISNYAATATTTTTALSFSRQATPRTFHTSRSVVLRQQQQQQQVDDEGRWIRRSKRNAEPISSKDDNDNDNNDDGGWDDIVDDSFNNDWNDSARSSSSSSSGPSRSSSGGGGGWDDFEPFSSVPPSPYSRSKPPMPRSGGSSSSSSRSSRSSPSRPQKSRDGGGSYSSNNWQDEKASKRPSSNRNDDRRNPYPKGRGGGGGERFNRNKEESSSSTDDRKINMRALEGAGFVHLYGLAPVLNALHANRRDFSRPEDGIDLDLLQGTEALQHELKQRERKPEARFSPCLFVLEQEYLAINNKAATGAGSAPPRKGRRRSADKALQAQQVHDLACKRGLAIAPVDKGVLNTLSQNRPHQGYVLRCGKLDWEPLSRIPHADKINDSSTEETSSPVPRFWLVLDEVVDPQNLGALLRSAYFLGGTSFNSATTTSSSSSSAAAAPVTAIGVLVCAKNSAPPSPTVSASSAGALELLNVYSTSNLPRTLAMAEADGFRIIGAAASVPMSSSSSRDGGNDGDVNPLDVDMYDLQDLPPLSSSLEQNENHHQPTLLVLGSEGHGLRNLVARSCTEIVRIPGMTINNNNNIVDSENDDDADDETDSVAGVDSLNVSVTGGILLWHLLRGRVSAN